MFSLLQGFYEELTLVPERRIALLGVESAGKSCILEWIKLLYKDTYETLPPPPATLKRMHTTVGLNVAKVKASYEKLLIWDLGGKKALRPIWENYVADAEALIWVVDSADMERMEESAAVLKELLEQPNLKHSPLLVMANKQDLDDALDPVSISLKLDMLNDADSRPQCVQPTSAETGSGIKEGLEWLLEGLRGEGKIEMRIPAAT